MNKIILVLIILLIIMCLAGWWAYTQYMNLNNNLGTGNLFDGLRFVGNYTWAEAIQHSQDAEHGHWIAINVRGLTYENAIEMCKHEVAHEIFALYCAKDDNIDKCMNLTIKKVNPPERINKIVMSNSSYTSRIGIYNMNITRQIIINGKDCWEVTCNCAKNTQTPCLAYCFECKEGIL